MGFRSTVPLVIPALSSAITIKNTCLVYYASGPAADSEAANPAYAAPAVRPTRVYKATTVSANGEEAVAVKINTLRQIKKEVSATFGYT